MSISIQTLHDAIVALITVGGVAAALSAAFIAAGAFFERGKARPGTTRLEVPAQHPTQTDDARELVLR